MILGHGRNKTSPQTFPQGCSVLRIHDSGCNWGQLEPTKGQFTWTPLDTRITEAEAHSMQVLYTFSNTPSWAGLSVAGAPPGLPSATGNLPADIDASANFTVALMDRYGPRIQFFELWNEWNCNRFYAGTVDQLKEDCRYKYAIIKSKNPHATVLTPSCTYSWAQNNILTALPQLLEAGFQDYADGIAIHGYLPPGAPALNIVPTLTEVEDLLTKYNLPLPVYDTESGWGVNTNLPDAAKSQYIVDWLSVRLQYGLEMACWYQWDNTTHGTLCNQDGTLNPAGLSWMNTWKAWHA